jgi:hypothetical protein
MKDIIDSSSIPTTELATQLDSISTTVDHEFYTHTNPSGLTITDRPSFAEYEQSIAKNSAIQEVLQSANAAQAPLIIEARGSVIAF